MAIVATYHWPNGAISHVHDDCIAEDQEAAWAHVREVHAQVYWAIERRRIAAEQAAREAQEQNRTKGKGDASQMVIPKENGAKKLKTANA
ncbi:MAG: hypothetical protein RR065_11370 [Clostridia bacterium]